MTKQLKNEKLKLEKKHDIELDIKEKRALKRLIHLKGIELIDSLGSKSKKKAFNPQKSTNIRGLEIKPVCLNYIPFLKGAYNLLTGRGGSGKSAVALKSMMVFLKANPESNGMAFFSEDGILDVKERISIIAKNMFSEVEYFTDRMTFITIENDDRTKLIKKSKDEYIINTSYINEMETYIKENNVGFVILDPLKRFHTLSENSNDDMDILVRDVFTSLAVKTNSVLLVLHHSAKGGDGASSRGASTITDSARLGWHIGRFYIRNKESHEIILDENKLNKIKLSIIKDNNGLESKCNIRNDDYSIPNPLKPTFTVTEASY